MNKRDIVRNKIKNLLNIDACKIHARKCMISEVNSKEKDNFLEKYHLQGKDKSGIKIGAYYNNELVSIMTFSKLRVALGSKHVDRVFEMSRFCSSAKVMGVASKLLSFFVNKYNPTKIIAYADRCWTTEKKQNVYQKIGFTKVSNGVPNYWYIVNARRKHRFSYRKNILCKLLDNFDRNLTEYENMKNNGYLRIWDCGSFKYELNMK